MLTIKVPAIPPRECNTNYHGSIRGKIRATGQWRDTCYCCAVSARNEAWLVSPIANAVIKVEFIVPHKGYERDFDNTCAGMKPAIDALVRAAILEGDQQKDYKYAIPFIWTPDKSRAPLTIIMVSKEGERCIT